MRVRFDWLNNIEGNDTYWMRAGVFIIVRLKISTWKKYGFLDDCQVASSPHNFNKTSLTSKVETRPNG